MGTDCGILISKQGELKRINLDRLYVFAPNKYESMKFMTDKEFIKLIDISFLDNYIWNKGDQQRKDYVTYWLNKCLKIIERNPYCIFAVYTDNDDPYGHPTIFKSNIYKC